MITFVRTVSIAPGKNAEAMVFTHQVVKYVKEHMGVQIVPNVPIGGNPNRIAFVSSYASLAEMESVMTKMMGDAGYMKLVAGNAPNVLPGSVVDEIWRSV